VIRYNSFGVSEGYVASIFRAEEQAEPETILKKVASTVDLFLCQSKISKLISYVKEFLKRKSDLYFSI
jgi:hypothetical protein